MQKHPPSLPKFLMGPLEGLFNVRQLFRQIVESLRPVAREENWQRHFLQTVARQDHESLNRFMEENPLLVAGEPRETEPVQLVACQIQRGVIPGLIDLAREFPADAESPQARQLLHRFTYFLNQAGELGEMRSEQLRLALGLRKRKILLRHLEILGEHPEAHTHKRQDLRQHQHYLARLIKETENALIPLLAGDPCRGDSIHLNARKQAYPCWMQKTLRWLEAFRQYQHAAELELSASHPAG